jgi:hypothetical protein|tara:strand:+ start:144 stop:524 length:381 start_codon:yes stop_codon:yes gene_type:complete
MPVKVVPTKKGMQDIDRSTFPKQKKKKKSPKGGGPLMTPGQKKMLDKQTGRGKPMEAMGGGMMKKSSMSYAGGGSLKPVPEGNKGKGLSKLPTEVRNKMGFMKKGGKVMKMRGGGMASRGISFRMR